MNERDKEFAAQAEAYADRDFKGEINWAEAYESKLIDLIRADEREACAKTVETIETYEKIEKACFKFAAKTIRARGNT